MCPGPGLGGKGGTGSSGSIREVLLLPGHRDTIDEVKFNEHSINNLSNFIQNMSEVNGISMSSQWMVKDTGYRTKLMR